MSETQATQASAENPVSAMEVYGKAAKELPSATVELAQEAWKDPIGTIGHGVKTLATSAVVGSAMAYVLPAKGPTAWAVGAALTIPMVISGYRSLSNAVEEAQKPGANVDAVAHTLARHTVSGTAELAINLAGGIGGMKAGYALKDGPGRIGSIGQATQRGILETENKFLSYIVNHKVVRGIGETGPNPKLPIGKITNLQAAEGANTVGLSRFDAQTVLPENINWYARPFTGIMRRVREYDNRDVVTNLPGSIAKVQDDYLMAQGSLHIHTNQSDGMGTVTSISKKAKEAGQNVILFTDHNHLAARDGVKPGDPRIPDQTGPVIAEAPKWYAQQFAEAAQQSVNGKFIALVGTEMGTIGKVGNPHSGGKNHFLMVEMPQFFEAIRRKKTVMETALSPFRKAMGIKDAPDVVVPEVVKYNDGDMNALVTYIAKNGLKDTAGKDPIFIMAHPRWSQDHAPSIPTGSKGADYGRYSFKTKEEWVTKAGKHFAGIEVIKGGAMRRDPIDEVGSKDIDFTSFKAFINEGFHVSPTVGRDAHFGNPVGVPAETGIWVTALDKAGTLAGLRSRRTFATTNMERLNGRVVANDRYQMGSIFDQAVTNELSLTTKLGGKVEPEAQYSLKLWADRKIGDRTMADVVQEVKMSGAELNQLGNEFTFETIRHTLGKRAGAYFVEVARKDPVTSHSDRMFMAPFWVEPLSGGGKHSLLMEFLAGQAPTTFPTGN